MEKSMGNQKTAEKKQQSKVMPHSFEAEEAVLGCIITDSEMAADLLPELLTEDFYSESCKIAYEAIKRAYDKNKAIDFVTVCDELERNGEMEKAGGIDFVTRLTTTVPSTANASHYLEIVKELGLKRRLIRASQSIVDEALKNDEDNILAYAEKAIYDISAKNERKFPTEISDAFNEVVDKFSKIAKDKGAFRGVTTGIKALDEVLHGLQKSDLILLAARPSEGKTSLAMNFIENAAILGKATCLVFSLEMSKVQLAQRMLCSHARVSMSKALNGTLEMREWEQLWAAKEELGNTNILIDDTSSITPSDMISKCRRVKAKYGKLDLVMVDYIQLMTSGKKSNSDNRQQEVSEISRKLKLLARELDCPVLALSQLSRLIENRKPPIPQLSDLRESGAIEQDADVVMFIYNPNKASSGNSENFNGNGNSGLKDIIIAKHRNGETTSVPVRWIGEYVRFEDAGVISRTPTNNDSENNYNNNDMSGDIAAFDDIPMGDLTPPPEE